MFYAQINSKNNLVGIDTCRIIKESYNSEDVQNIEVTEDIYNNAKQYGTNYYIYSNGQIIINPDYEAEQEEKRRQEFLASFFNTSLGWVSRKVHMKDGSIKDFLSDILPLLQIDVPIITYNIDGTQNVGVKVTSQFIEECKQQVLIDFYGVLQNDV